MEFAAKIRELEKRSKHATKLALTEEATKTSVVLPFIQALGFDVFNLDEVVPEFIADVGLKKGEKVDFALKIGGKLSVLIEVKPILMNLGSAQYSQLYRYFAVTEAKLAILTNGREVWFFSDVDEPNKMDKKPFFTFDLQAHDEAQVLELSRFQKTSFSMEVILEAASNMKYVTAASGYLKKQLTNPDDEFVKLIGRQIYDGMLTKAVVESLRPAIQASLDDVIRDRIRDKLNVAFRPEAEAPERPVAVEVVPASDVVTTEDELQAFMIVRAIAARLINVERITMRDAKSYCSVFVDDNNRKPVCRFHFNAKSVRYIGFFDTEKAEERLPIEKLSDIFLFNDRVEAAVKQYM
ncbi:restriction endonuclease [Cereibacter changlensis]|uniref:Restriction endonuclease n=1 Tax=Cereibacter changlensis TaxID=402884 RepID=A0A4U0YX78_9RHOB|nr:type I restriction enzyme HsdR N-terminal domain-containing protein [Cereibacter changlensis]TKA97412.1 restriction endonuclease [Cereibacter changlensis]